MRIRTRQRAQVVLVVLLVTVGLVLSGCGSDTLSETPTPEPDSAGQSTDAPKLVLGNIDATNPSEKIAEFQPLVDYLVAHLGELGIEEGEVVIAQDTGEMARMISAGEVDIYIDAAIPSLEVCSLSGCEFALRQWKGGGPELSGVFVIGKESEIASLEDLQGKVVMLEQPHSTVGHILPLAALMERGITTRRVEDMQATVAEDEVGYIVAPGGQSSMNFLLNGEIDALAIGERAYERFSPDVQAQVKIIDHTVAAPSQLVSFRPGFDAELAAEISSLMIALEETEEGKQILESLRDTARFDQFPAELSAELDELWETVQAVIGE